MKLKQVLCELSELHAPTGEERDVAAYMATEFRKHGFEVRGDVLGNVIAKKGKGRKKILVAAHMDEIGLAVKSVTEKGFLRFAKVGGIYDALLGTARVVVHAKGRRLPGVIGAKPPHLMKDEEMKKLQESDVMYVDIGAKDKKDAEKKGVHPGTPISFESKFIEMDENICVGKAFDDRTGCAVLLKLAEETKVPKDVELYLVGTVREETGLWGAGTSAYALEPDLAVAVDVTMASGAPDVSEEEVPVILNKGPVIGVLEAGGRGCIMSRKLVEWIEGIAERNRVPYQYEIHDKGASDASRMQYVKSGILTASIGIPCRYVHSRSEMVDMRDMEATSKLVDKMIAHFPEYK